MSFSPAIKILVTGDHEDLNSRFPSELGHRGQPLEWISIPVFSYERLQVDPDILKALDGDPPDWLIFTSQRSVGFWVDLLLEHGMSFPTQTQVAAIGQRTAEIANQEGFTPDFYPTEPGTEKFLEEFQDLLSNTYIKPYVFIPMAEGGRTTLRDELSNIGCRVKWVSLYRSVPKEDLLETVSQNDVDSADIILFTSPNSVDVFKSHFKIPKKVQVASIGRYTLEHLSKMGIKAERLPDGDFERIGELLC